MMNTIKDFLKKPWAWNVIAGLAGVLFGLIILGWWLMPVQWKDATPAYLRQDIKADYLRMTVDSYAVNKDVVLAKTRWESLGKDAEKLFSEIQIDTKNISSGDLAAFARVVNTSISTGAPAVEQPAVEEPAAATTPEDSAITPGTGGETILPAVTETPKKTGFTGILPVALGLFCVLTLVLGFVVVYIFLKKGKFPGRRVKQDAASDGTDTGFSGESSATKGAEFFRNPGESPVSQFMTTYMQGDEQYDDSFSIDNPMGEFLGECGVGISDTIGVGDPKKVAAFEVWLFDKNDIQTVTKVLMGEHTFSDPASQQRLMSKGEPILAEPGKRILLETATLQLEARIVDMNYGQGPLPPNSYFDRLTLELAVWPKGKA